MGFESNMSGIEDYALEEDNEDFEEEELRERLLTFSRETAADVVQAQVGCVYMWTRSVYK